MPANKLVELLLVKAAQDEYVLDKLVADQSAPQVIFGFHAQQAVEKLLKAVLSQHGIEYQRTHRLAELVDLARDHEVHIPPVVEELIDLTPYAVEFRYDAAPDEGDDFLDRADIRRKIQTFRDWVVDHVRG